jgi:hypothetical protein
MNDEQKTCLWIGIAVIALMAIFPPTPHGCYYRALYGGFGPKKEEPPIVDHIFHCGYTFLFTAKTSKAFDKLFVQWAVVALITAGLIYTHKAKEDNKKQRICLLIGTAVIVLMAIFPPADKRLAFFFTAKAEEIEYTQLLIQCSVVAVITAVLFYTLRNKKDKKLTANQKQ